MAVAKEPRKKFKTPMRTVEADDMANMLNRSIFGFESRYEMSSSTMLDMVERGEMDESPEILKWMQDFHALQLLAQTPTSGRRSSSTE